MSKISPRAKHIVILYNFFITQVKVLEIKTVAINIEKQPADQFIKGIYQDTCISRWKIAMIIVWHCMKITSHGYISREFNMEIHKNYE